MSYTFLPSWVHPMEVLHNLLGSKGERHVLAAATAARAASSRRLKKSLRGQSASNTACKCLKKTGEKMCITANRFRCILRRLACSTADLLFKIGGFWAVFRRIVLKT